MHFTDEKGFLRGVPSGKFFNPRNAISKAIAKDDKGFAMAMKDEENNNRSRYYKPN